MTEKSRVSIVKSELPVSKTDIETMVKKGLDLLGGIEKFVKSGQTVVIKPNLFAPYPPPISVDRRVIGALVSLVKSAGAKKIIVIEGVSVGTLMKRINTKESEKSTGMLRGLKTVDVMKLIGVKRAVEEAGGEIIGAEDAQRECVIVPGGKVLHFLDYPKIILDADVFINVPALKTHTMTMVTLGIKNLQGILTEGDRYFGHRDDLDQHMVDISKVRKPDLVVIDGLIGMEGMGAGEGGSPVPMGLVISGNDIVATDTVASRVMGIENPFIVGTTRIAAHDGLGTMDLSKIEVSGEEIDAVSKKFLLPVNYTQPLDTFVTGVYPNVDVYIGGACQTCWLMAALALPNLAKIPSGPNEKTSLICGIDPKVPTGKNWDLENTFILGDCALGCSGETREIRNSIAIAGFDTFLPGCPPYEQALVKLEDILIKRGVLKEESLIDKAKEHRDKFFDYYKKLDPTWEPEI